MTSQFKSPLTSFRQERFAQELAMGRSQGEAYALSGYRLSTVGARDANASRLLTNAKVAARVAELRAEAAAMRFRSPDESLRLSLGRGRRNTRRSLAGTNSVILASHPNGQARCR